MLRSRATVSRTLPALRLQQQGPSTDWVTLRYCSRDPYAVEAQLLSGRPAADSWVFARDLLTAGLMQWVGEGNVRVWPWLAAATGRDAVRVAMRSPEAAVHVQLDAADVVEFLELSQTVVRLGNESAHLDLDSALRTWVA